ncbi:MAG: hypothetical protein KC636_01290 [Myxococcales bacterium]|nr:hypothetical protein [Myxococcales bacterium]
MNEPLSPSAFQWLLTLLTGGLSVAWLVYDALNLLRARALDTTDAIVRDQRVGYVVGIVSGLLGVIGCLRFHDLL